MRGSIACLIVVLTAGCGAHAASLLKNGGFEQPVVAAGSYTDFAKGQKIGAWTVVGAGGAVAVVSGTFSFEGYDFPASAGEQWLDLTGANSNEADGVEQTVKTVAGGTYRLTFRVGNVSGGIFGTSSTVNVLINGIQAFAATNSTPGTTLNWKKFSYSFQATSASTVLDFINGDPLTDNSNALDSVSLVAAP